MATYFSEHFQPLEQSGATAAVTPAHRAAPGVGDGRVRAKKASFIFPVVPATNDVLRLFKMKSTDRLLRFSIANHGLAASGAAYDVGIRKLDLTNGTGMTSDCVIDGYAGHTASEKLVDSLGAGTNSVFNVDADEAEVGAPLWKALGYSADPQETWEVYCTVQAAGATPAVGGIVFVAEYISGGS